MKKVTNLADHTWRKRLLLTKEKQPKRCLANVMVVLTGHPDWKGVLAFDEFGQCVVTLKDPPMRDCDAPQDYSVGDWSDIDTTRTVAWFASEVDFEPTPGQLDQAVEAVARKNIVHPVRDWLSGLTWDGNPRIDDFVADYFGGHRGPYSAAVGRRWMISAVARAFQPGSKVDTMLVLEGTQGIGKSSALRLLAGAEWFADSGLEVGNKDSFQKLRRKWVYEFGELSELKRFEIERIKNFLSSPVDNYRPSYARRAVDHPRQVVFAGSTNDSEYLIDKTGNRRFWPVKCSHFNLAAIERDRDQLWAETVAAYKADEPWHLDTPELRQLAAEEAAQREEQDDWLGFVEKWLEDPTVPDPIHKDHRTKLDLEKGFTTGDVLAGALGFDPSRIQPRDSKRVGHVLRNLGFFPRQLREGKSQVRKYFLTCDETCDNSESQKQLVSHVTCEMRDVRTGESNGPLFPKIGNPSVTPVTCDNFADIEREAIRAEGNGQL